MNLNHWMVFYINYEECKFICLAVENVHIIGFILTMRNVNVKAIDYVEIDEKGFILTMRNVNT